MYSHRKVGYETCQVWEVIPILMTLSKNHAADRQAGHASGGMSQPSSRPGAAH
jgi:hypothetical protein